jgi:uncharacterized protein
MEFDWLDTPLDLKRISPREIEEAFEDPFGLKLMPEDGASRAEARYVLLGRSLTGRSLFCVFWTDGKRFRVIVCREMTTEETNFYERKNAEML